MAQTWRPETPKKSVFEFCYKKVNSSLEDLIKILKSNIYCETRTVQIETSQKIGNSFKPTCELSRPPSKSRFRRRSFHEPNLIRPAELIQTPILIAAELSSKGEIAHFCQTAYKIRRNNL